ncbi:MAG: hypothetical protein RSA90_05060 [Lachnospiraceae bacterium]
MESNIRENKELQKEIQQELQSEEQLAEDSLLMKFLDITSNQEKIKFLQYNRMDITEDFIAAIAHSLDYTENEGTLDERYQSIVQYLHTLVKYESGRLR